MGKLEEKIFNKIKNKKNIDIEKEPKQHNIYSLVGIVWMFLLPIMFVGIVCKIFFTDPLIISFLISISILFGIYNIIKIISDVYKEKKWLFIVFLYFLAFL